ncbi:MAG TPA: amidohydrolase family protein [Longimicrobiales bacterium]
MHALQNERLTMIRITDYARRGILLAAFAALAAPAPTTAADPGRPRDARDDVVAFIGVNVVPMDAERVLENQTVVVRDGRIAALGPAGDVAVPDDAIRIDARGKYLVPGIAEMHGHLPGGNTPPEVAEAILFLFVANGVTTVRGMQGNPAQFTLRARIERGELIGPTLYLGSPALHGNRARTPEEGARLVREYHAAGFDLLKVHEGLSPATYDAIAATARELGLAWGGHVADDVGLEHALAAGQSTIDHLDGYLEALGDDPTRIPALARATREAGAWVVPTMTLWDHGFLGVRTAEELRAFPELKYVPRPWVENWTEQLRNLRQGQDPATYARGRELRRRLLKALADAEVGILLGSDAPQMFNVPGFSLHREMQVMAEAGLTPYQILRSGTRNVAAYFDALDEFGTIAVGRRADLILLEANPLDDVAHLRRRAGVMVRGRWLSEGEIQERLAGIAQRFGG